MTIDHDAIAARVRQNREAGTPGPWRIKNCDTIGDRCTHYFQEIWNDETDIIVTTEVTRAHNDGGAANMRRIAALPDLEAAYLDLYDEVARLRADLHHVIAERDATFALMLARAEKAESGRRDMHRRAQKAEAERDDWMRACNLAVQERMAAEAERDALRAALAPAMDACKILDGAVKAGYETTSDLFHHLLFAVEPARAALKGHNQ